MTITIRNAVMLADWRPSRRDQRSGSGGPATTAPQPTLGSALRATKPIFDARLRAERVDQDPLADDADAMILRLRAGFETGKAWNTSLLAEGELVTPISGDYRPDNAHDASAIPGRGGPGEL